jgi:hypothetical protein
MLLSRVMWAGFRRWGWLDAIGRASEYGARVVDAFRQSASTATGCAQLCPCGYARWLRAILWAGAIARSWRPSSLERGESPGKLSECSWKPPSRCGPVAAPRSWQELDSRDGTAGWPPAQLVARGSATLLTAVRPRSALYEIGARHHLSP